MVGINDRYCFPLHSPYSNYKIVMYCNKAISARRLSLSESRGSALYLGESGIKMVICARKLDFFFYRNTLTTC